MAHGVIDVFAFQEALLLEAVLGITLLAMIWVGFRRWLQHKERMDRLIAEQTAERAERHAADIERVEARLKAIEQALTDNNLRKAAEIEAPTSPADPPLQSGETQAPSGDAV